jgi:hypothetical protein
VTLTTPASSNLLLSTTATGTGSHSIAVLAASGSTSIPAFYAQALASSGTTDITATATGYSPGTAAATFTPSGFIVEGGTATSTLSATSPVTVSFAQLDPKTLAFTGGLTLRMGTTAVTVPLTDSDTAVGTVSASVVFKTRRKQRSSDIQTHQGWERDHRLWNYSSRLLRGDLV